MSFKYPDKYKLTVDEIKELKRKDQVKYFNKKRAFLLRKLLLKPFNAVEEFEKLSDEQLAVGVITEEDRNEYDKLLSKQMEEYQSMTPYQIKEDIQREIKELKTGATSKVKGWFGR